MSTHFQNKNMHKYRNLQSIRYTRHSGPLSKWISKLHYHMITVVYVTNPDCMFSKLLLNKFERLLKKVSNIYDEFDEQSLIWYMYKWVEFEDTRTPLNDKYRRPVVLETERWPDIDSGTLISLMRKCKYDNESSKRKRFSSRDEVEEPYYIEPQTGEKIPVLYK